MVYRVRMVYAKQAEEKHENQRRIWMYLFSRPLHWASWTELLESKEVNLSKRALARNLKEMQKPNADYPIVKQQRPLLLSGSTLEDLYENKGIFRGVHKAEGKKILAEWSRDYEAFAKKNNLGRIEVLTKEIDKLDNQIEKALLSENIDEANRINDQAKPLREERNKLQDKIIEYLDRPRETFYRKKMLRRIVDKHFKPPKKPGYTITSFEIEHGRK